nr:F-box/kelch-repeat protein At3g23880-like [Ipomoea batatas]
MVFGFGYNERNDDYKDFYAYYADNGNENVVLVYNFKHGSWKRSERGFNSGFVNPRIVMCFHHKRQIEIWVMNEYEVEESWTKLVCNSNLPVHHPLPRGLENSTYMAIFNNTSLKLIVHVDGWYTRLTRWTTLKTIVVDHLVANPLHQSSFTNQSWLVKQAKGIHITSYRITNNIGDIKILNPFTIRPMEL